LPHYIKIVIKFDYEGLITVILIKTTLHTLPYISFFLKQI